MCLMWSILIKAKNYWYPINHSSKDMKNRLFWVGGQPSKKKTLNTCWNRRKANTERNGLQVHVDADGSGKNMNCSAEMAKRYLCDVCGEKHEDVCIPDAAAAAVIANLPCAATKDINEHLLKLDIFKSTGKDNWNPSALREPTGSFQISLWYLTSPGKLKQFQMIG